MIDLHTHVLWGIDDGSKDINMSKEMLRIAAYSGTTDIVATPHVIEKTNMPDWGGILAQTEALNKMAADLGLNIEVYGGAEVQMNWELLDKLGERGKYCINGSRYMLVELPMRELPSYASEFWYQLQLKGISPILAHPERYPLLHSRPDILLSWRKQGVLMQCNSGSFLGAFGEDIANNALLLLQNGLVDCIGSDAHRSKVRSTDMSLAVDFIRRRVGVEVSERILSENPRAILDNQDICLNKPDAIKQLKKPNWLGRLFARKEKGEV